MRFSASTVYSAEKLLKFNKFTAFEKKWFWLFLFFCTAMCSASFAVLSLRGSFNLTAFVCLILVSFLDVFYVFVSFALPKISLKKSPTFGATVNFEFYTDSFTVHALTKVGKKSASHRYSSLLKARETENDIYLYIAKQQAYIVDKSSIAPSSIDDFKEFLKNRNLELK